MRSNGGIIGGKKTVSTSAASGIWALRDAQRERGGSNWPTTIYTPYRYLRYTVGAATNGHHPRASRHILTVGGVDINVAVFTSDNCADSGTIYSSGQYDTLDLGANSNAGVVTAAKIYVSYGGGARGANYSVSGSNDNSSFTTIFSGNMTSSACGILTGTIV